jgi:hypothetical protein
VYLTGYSSGETKIGGTTMKGNLQNTALVAKANSAGTFLWANQLATKSGTSAGNAVVASNGDVFVAGAFGGPYADFGSIRITNAGGRNGMADAFVTRLNTNGNIIWAVGAGGIGYDAPYSIAADAFGNVFIGGEMGNQARFGSDVHQSGQFVAQLNAADGQFLDTWRLGPTWQSGSDGIFFRGLTTNAASDLYVTGQVIGTAAFPDGTAVTSNNESSDIFVVRFARGETPASVPPVPISRTIKNASIDSGRLDTSSVDLLLAEAENTWTRSRRQRFLSIGTDPWM